MSIPPIIVTTAKLCWNWQWNQLMNGLAPADQNGNYERPKSEHQKASVLQESELICRSKKQLPHLLIGRSCPWAHRTWLIYALRNLGDYLNLLVVKVDKEGGRWIIDPPWLGCNSLLALYRKCNQPPSHRATVPVLIDPGTNTKMQPNILGNESAQIIEVLNQWPTKSKSLDLFPKPLQEEINNWQKSLQNSVNDGVYRCGFARNQQAYNKASAELFQSLNNLEESLHQKGPWLCGEQITLADVRLFPTLIRWEAIYEPLFGCSQKPLWCFPNLWNWRQRFMKLPNVSKTCDVNAWRNDYFGALFPLRPSNIVPAGADLMTIVNANHS